MFTTLILINAVKGVRNGMKKIKEEKAIDTALVKLVYIEHVGDRLMAFDAVTKSFIAQALDNDALWAEAQARFPNYKLIQTELDKAQ
jgi:hypothetical protein